MSELGLICKQPGPHAYKRVTVERPGILNHLAREFTVDRQSGVVWGDITYIWSGQRWSYLAVTGSVCPMRCWLDYVIQRGNCWDTQSAILENIVLVFGYRNLPEAKKYVGG